MSAQMQPEDDWSWNNPKYKTFCNRVHVTKAARNQAISGILSACLWPIAVWYFWGYIGWPLLIFLAYAVFEGLIYGSLFYAVRKEEAKFVYPAMIGQVGVQLFQIGLAIWTYVIAFTEPKWIFDLIKEEREESGREAQSAEHDAEAWKYFRWAIVVVATIVLIAGVFGNIWSYRIFRACRHFYQKKKIRGPPAGEPSSGAVYRAPPGPPPNYQMVPQQK